ncbi:MAG: methyltransferase domain-containing protein, partial [Polyangiaceae bacterium]|nr:methyltransferase domain-containing protein [Polyangiaceae bacterium]
FGLVTNGRMLAYPALVEKLLERRLRYVYLSLHGGTARVHNALVRADAFEQTYAAIGNLAGRGLDFTVNTVVTRQNIDHLRGVVDALVAYPDVVVKFSMVQPKGGADKLFEQIIPRVSRVAEKVADAIRHGLERTGGQGLYAHDGIPFCLLPEHAHLYDDLRTHRFMTMIEVGEADFFPVDDRAKVQPSACRGCSLRGPCPGLYRGYREIHGDAELCAVPGLQSNSFHYVRKEHVGTVVGERCPVREGGVTPWDRGRDLFLREGDDVWRYRCDSRDFPDVEIEHAKRELGQLYVDVSGRDAPDDFARDLVKVAPSRLCADCPERGACAGMYERSGDNVFLRDEGRLRAIVAALRGDVLDIGCGEGRYGDVLAPLAETGLVRYVGVDPDERRVLAVRGRFPWADVRQGDAESIDAPAGFDHVLLLRSWNHLHDPARAIDAVVRALRPGGTVTIADDVPFGLLRDPAQAARAEGGGAGFEHRRNDDASRAAQMFSRTPLVLFERSDAGPETSTLWVLRYRAPRAPATRSSSPIS